MNEIENFVRINELFATYGRVLTHRQQLIMESYYVFNLGVQEIADEFGISKAAVSDALKVSVNHLETLEKNIGQLAYKSRMRALHQELINTTTDERVKARLKEEDDNGIWIINW